MSNLPKSFKPARTSMYKDHLTPWRPEYSVLIPSSPVHYSELKQVMQTKGDLVKEARREASQELKAVLYTAIAIEKAQREAKGKAPKDYGAFPDGTE